MMKVLSRAVGRLVCVTIGVLGISFLAPNDTLAETKAPVFGWIKDPSTSRWWYKNSDGTYPTNSWVWLDGDRNGLFECYFFDNEGWMLSNTTTPDGYTVDENGAWTTKDGQVERRTDEELKPKVEEAKPEEEKPKVDQGMSSTSTLDPTVPIPIPEPKEVDLDNSYVATKEVVKDGLLIYSNKKDGDSIGGFISDEEFERLVNYAWDKGFRHEYTGPNGEWITDNLALSYRISKNYSVNDPKPNIAHAYGRIYNGDKYVELHLWMDEGNDYGTYSIHFYKGDGGFTYMERATHTKAYSIAEMKEAIDHAAGHPILRN